MVSTREIYWNVGQTVVWPMYVFAFTALGLCAWGFFRRIRFYRHGRSLNRLDQFPLRVRLMLVKIAAQTRVVHVPAPGMLHALFFWSFGVLFLGTLLVMAQADFSQPLFGVALLEGGFYELYSLVLDLAGLAGLLMLGGLLVRRFFAKPAGLETVRDDYLAHALLFAILISGFATEGVRLAATELVNNPQLARFSPVGSLAGSFFLGMQAPTLSLTHAILWWLHFFFGIGFIAAIPFTKLRHIFTTGANYLFADLGPKGAVATMNLDDEKIEQFGAATIAGLTWKDIFDSDACTSCNRCQDSCPAWLTEKPLSPMKLVQKIGALACGKPAAPIAAAIPEEAVWACTTCRACQQICPAEIEHVNKIIEMRRNLTLMEGAFPGDEVRTAIGNVEVNGNPFGLACAARGEWAEGLDVTLAGDAGDVDILYFAGCYASFDNRNRQVARAFVTICNAAGIKVGILGKRERCCGEPARKLGNEYLYQMTARGNIEAFKTSGIKNIVTTCPHCFNTLGRDYRDLGLDLPVEHHTTFIHGLLQENRLILRPKPFEVTYHDSCYIGRYRDIIDQPRWVLRAAGGKLTEMEKSKYDSFCCGAGGGRILAEEKLGSRINTARVRMAEATGAKLVVSNCPFCLAMFEDGVKTCGREMDLGVRDLAEIVAERLTL